jgi:hypothetical protein
MMSPDNVFLQYGNHTNAQQLKQHFCSLFFNLDTKNPD